MIDLNCDLGELNDGSDLAVMPYISSCNITCGGHAGSPELMAMAVDEAIKHQVTIGAHPGYPDKENFGRISLDLTDSQIYSLIVNQVKQLWQVARKKGAVIRYVKLHGALYHDAATDIRIARSVVSSMKEIPDQLSLLGPANSMLEETAVSNGINFFYESFVDRRYQEDGHLVPRSEPTAILSSIEEVKQQLLSIILKEKVKTIEGKVIRLKTDSICIHGDHPDSLQTARVIKNTMDEQGIKIKSFLD